MADDDKPAAPEPITAFLVTPEMAERIAWAAHFSGPKNLDEKVIRAFLREARAAAKKGEG